MKQPAVLEEKARRYENLLKRALSAFEVLPPENSHLRKVSDDFSIMASSYHEDGLMFMKEGDMVNALACFSYGHAWLDAGVKLGIFKVTDENLFTI